MNTWCLEVGSRGRNFKSKIKFWLFFLKLRNQHFISLCKILKQEASWPYKLRCKTLYMYQYRPHPTIPIHVCGCGLIIVLGERLWNSLNTTIGACHGLLHSLKIYTTQTPFHYPNCARTECLWNSLHRTIANDQWLLNSLKHIQLFEFWPFFWPSRPVNLAL